MTDRRAEKIYDVECTPKLYIYILHCILKSSIYNKF